MCKLWTLISGFDTLNWISKYLPWNQDKVKYWIVRIFAKYEVMIRHSKSGQGHKQRREDLCKVYMMKTWLESASRSEGGMNCAQYLPWKQDPRFWNQTPKFQSRHNEIRIRQDQGKKIFKWGTICANYVLGWLLSIWFQN